MIMQGFIKHNTDLLRLVLAVALFGLISSGNVQAQQSSDYAILKLPPIDGDFGQAWKINNNTQIVGHCDTDSGPIRACLWEQNIANAQWVVTDLGTYENEGSSAWSINDLGIIVGEATYDRPYEHAFRWNDGIVEYLGTFGGSYAFAKGINSQGLIVGETTTENDVEQHAFVWDNGKMIDLGIMGGNESWANDINDSGLIAGFSEIDEVGNEHAVIWDYDSNTGTFEGPFDIDVPESKSSYAYAVNNSAQVVGLWEHIWGISEAFIWDEINGMVSIHTLPNWSDSKASDVNEAGIVIGHVFNGWNQHAFVWESHNNMVLLDNLIPPNSRWTKVEHGLGINDLNQMVGNGQRSDSLGLANAYLMTPVNPTLQLSDAIPGIAGQVNSLEVSGVTPGTRVYFTYSRFGGGALIPGCDVSVNALQIENPKLAGSAVADANGVAKLTGKVPASLSGRELLFQAVVVGRCEISNLVV